MPSLFPCFFATANSFSFSYSFISIGISSSFSSFSSFSCSLVLLFFRSLVLSFSRSLLIPPHPSSSLQHVQTPIFPDTNLFLTANMMKSMDSHSHVQLPPSPTPSELKSQHMPYTMAKSLSTTTSSDDLRDNIQPHNFRPPSRRFSISSLFTLAPPKHMLNRKISAVSLPDNSSAPANDSKISLTTTTSKVNSVAEISSSEIDYCNDPIVFPSRSFQLHRHVKNTPPPACMPSTAYLNSVSETGPTHPSLHPAHTKHNNDAQNASIINSNMPVNYHPSSKRTLSSNTQRKAKGEGYGDFKLLDSEYHKFMSKTGVTKANILRLALLPVLRQQRGEFSKANPEESSKRVRILQKWWLGILSALRDRERTVSGSDRSAYLEAVSGLIVRNEWALATGATREIFESLLYDTLRYVIAKLSLKTVPVTFSAFAGKVIAYAFFFAPGVAPVLLHLLSVSKADVKRLMTLSFPTTHTHQYTDIESAADLLRSSFPSHVSMLIASTNLSEKPPAPSLAPDLYGSWSRRWLCYNSDVFASFFKHYYTIIARILPAELPWNAHLASPGLIIIHAFFLRTLDYIVNPRKHPPRSYVTV